MTKIQAEEEKKKDTGERVLKMEMNRTFKILDQKILAERRYGKIHTFPPPYLSRKIAK
jgi:hypothetical protein